MDCIHRIETGGERVVCLNTVDLVHDGTVPQSFCERCPYCRIRPKDFFSQTSQLWVDQQRSGEYRPKPKGCGSCRDTKHAIDGLQFVWPYWHAGADGDEIRWSVRSVETFFQGKAKTLIIGDRPPWYHGPHISQRRVGPQHQHQSFRDMLTKMWTMATHPDVERQFIWMMDDVYFLKPFSEPDLETPRAYRWDRARKNKWQILKADSMEALAMAGLPNHDFATHAPHHVEKDKLRQLFDLYDLHNRTLLWEVLYGNTFRTHPASVRPWLARIGREFTKAEYPKVFQRATVANHTQGTWCRGLRDYLAELLPDAASSEIGSPGKFIRKSRPVRPVVKRRPVETHRAYKERQAAE